MVHQNLSHRSCEDSVKVSSVFPLARVISLNLYVCFVHERGRAQGVARLLADHIALRHSAKIVVDDIKQLVSGSLVTSEPFVQEISDVSPCHGELTRVVSLIWMNATGVYSKSLFAGFVFQSKRLRIILLTALPQKSQEYSTRVAQAIASVRKVLLHRSYMVVLRGNPYV